MTTDGRQAADALMARIKAAQGEKVGFQNPDEWLPRWREAKRRDFEKWHAQWQAEHPDEVGGDANVSQSDANASTAKRRTRKPSIRQMIRQAEKETGKTLTSLMTPDGYLLSFGEPETDQGNDLDKWMAKRHAH